MSSAPTSNPQPLTANPARPLPCHAPQMVGSGLACNCNTVDFKNKNCQVCSVQGDGKRCTACKRKKYLHPNGKCVKATQCELPLIPAGIQFTAMAVNSDYHDAELSCRLVPSRAPSVRYHRQLLTPRRRACARGSLGGSGVHTAVHLQEQEGRGRQRTWQQMPVQVNQRMQAVSGPPSAVTGRLIVDCIATIIYAPATGCGLTSYSRPPCPQLPLG